MQSTAAVLHASRRLALAELPVPDRLAPDELLLRVEGCGICGTDYEQYAGLFEGTGKLADYPLIPGHEPVGRVERIGDAAAARMRVQVGDRVAVQPHAGCGVCRYCTAGRMPLCPHKRVYGFVPLSVGSGLWGGFSEYMVLQGNTVLHKLPEHVSIQDAVLFNPLAAGFEWVVAIGGTGIGDDVLILGPGQRGLAGVIAAVAAGANRIVVTGLEQDRHKLEIARSLGATETVVVDPRDPAALTRALAGQSFDQVIDVTPFATQPINDAIALVRPGGTVVLGGLKGDARRLDLCPDPIVLKGIRICGARGVATRSYALAVRAVASGAYDFGPWHTHTMGLEDTELAIRVLSGELRHGPEPLHITIVP
ncbi:zinc-dependent alcohol dehydrogenase [Pseudorhodoferax sp.]|uniref:zinc-dependent alcohol dehydrogenase n=1 Tax=Pseudorhodoferax sp. TaxID=1993553 RepID=UPI0039E6AA73